MLRMLNDQSQRKTGRSFFETAQEGMRDWRAMMAQSEGKIGTPLQPQVVAAAFDRRLPQNAILVLDSGQNTEMAARHSDLQAGQAFSESGTLASMAFGLPYAIAAGLAFAGCPIFAVAGEFSTAVRYQIPLKTLVLKNNMLNQIAWEQMMFLGNPQFVCELRPIDFAMAAEAMGGVSYSVSRTDEVESVLDAAFATEGPVMIEADLDAYEPMMRLKMSADYARNFAKALRQTPGRQSIKENVAAEPLRSRMK